MFRTKNSPPTGYQDRVCGLALDYLSKMKIAVMVRQLDLGHILWCGRVVRVERGHRVRVVRGVQKMPDDPTAIYGVDFLKTTELPAGVSCIVTNPPYMLANEFAAHAVELCPKVVMLLRPLLDFAVSIKWIAENPTTDIKAKIPRKGEGFRAWGEEQIAAFRQRHALGTRARLAMELFLNTAQRRGDVVRMGPQHIRDDPEHGPILHVRQQKTDVSLHLPIFPELQEAIHAMPSKGRHLTFLVTASGKPFSPAGFTNWFRDACNEAGLHGFSAHGLRKASLTRFAEAGCSAHEIAAFGGHKTLSEIAHYTRTVKQAALTREAMAKARTKLSKTIGPTVKNRKKANENKS